MIIVWEKKIQLPMRLKIDNQLILATVQQGIYGHTHNTVYANS